MNAPQFGEQSFNAHISEEEWFRRDEDIARNEARVAQRVENNGEFAEAEWNAPDEEIVRGVSSPAPDRFLRLAEE
jgi:hypothetical protein